MVKLSTFCFILILNLIINAQDIVINKIEPPNWWEGMKNSKIELMVYGKGLLNAKVNSNNLRITKVESITSDNYLFVEVDLGETKV